MNIVYTFDDGYSAISAVSILSLLKSNQKVKDITIVIVDCGITKENREKLINLVKSYNRNIVFVDGTGMEKKIPVELELSYWSFVCYVRLFFSELLPDFDRVLHVDCDTLIEGELETVYNLKLDNGKISAAAYDCLPTAKYAANMKITDKYYSSGIILFDLKAMRLENIQQKFVDYIVEKKGKLPHLDQDVFNVVLKDRIMTLPIEYNLMTQTVLFGEKSNKFFSSNEPYYTPQEIKKGLASPILYHLVGFRYVSKPWAQPCYHPSNHKWLDYYCSLDFDPERKIIKYKNKKFGILRELICLIWNFCYKIPVLQNFEFWLEKKRVRKKCRELNEIRGER